MNITTATCKIILNVNCSLNESSIHVHQKRQEQLLNITCNKVNCIHVGTLFYENNFRQHFTMLVEYKLMDLCRSSMLFTNLYMNDEVLVVMADVIIILYKITSGIFFRQFHVTTSPSFLSCTAYSLCCFLMKRCTFSTSR